MKRSILLGLALLLLSCCTPPSSTGQDHPIDALPGHESALTTQANEGSERDSDSFTLIVLPDTQGYADVRHKETQKHRPDIGDQRSCFFQQTEWIKPNQQKLNIEDGSKSPSIYRKGVNTATTIIDFGCETTSERCL